MLRCEESKLLGKYYIQKTDFYGICLLYESKAIHQASPMMQKAGSRGARLIGCG